MRKNEEGFTLLELLLMLALLALMMIVSFRFYRFHQYEKSVAQLRQSLEMSLLLMNQYYYAGDTSGGTYRRYCHNDLTAVRMSNLRTWATTARTFSSQQLTLISSNFDAKFSLSSVQTPTPHNLYTFQVIASFAKASFTQQQVQQWQATLNADNVITSSADNTAWLLTWSRLPLQSIGQEAGGLWIANRNLQAKISLADATYQTACPQ